jgi:hypothetical protein
LLSEQVDCSASGFDKVSGEASLRTMELCVRMQVSSAGPACYLEHGCGHSGKRRLSASVSALSRRHFVGVGRSRVEKVQRRGSQKNPFWCRIEAHSGGGGGSGNGGSGGGGGKGDKEGGDGPFPDHTVLGLLLAFSGIVSVSEIQRWCRVPAVVLALFLLQQQAALALSGAKEEARTGVWEVKGGRWKYLVKHPERDEFVVATVKNSEEEALAYEEELVKGATVNRDSKPNGVKLGVNNIVTRFVELSKQVLLPDGYPGSVTDDYMEYTLWRMGQVIASQISGVLTTQVSSLPCCCLQRMFSLSFGTEF